MNHTVSATLTKAAGAHSLRTGLEYRIYQENDKFFGFQQTGTVQLRLHLDPRTAGQRRRLAWQHRPIGRSAAAGTALTSSNVARSAAYIEQSNSWGFFVQDDWKVTAKLTVNLGMRWEFEKPLHERYNRSALGFDPSYVQPFSAAAQAIYAAIYPTISGGFTQLPPSAFALRAE